MVGSTADLKVVVRGGEEGGERNSRDEAGRRSGRRGA